MLQRTALRRSPMIQSAIRSRSISSSLAQPSRTRLYPLAAIARTAPASRWTRRWASTDSNAKPETSEAPSDPASASGEAAKAAEDPAKKELEAKNREIIDLKDKYLRSVAEFRNLQDRTKRDNENVRAFAIQRFATDLLESIDNLDRALMAVPAESLAPTGNAESPDNKDLINLHNGLKMTESILMSSLKKHGLERFDPSETGKERKFDPRVDEAVFMSPMEGKENGDILMTQSKGFMLNGRVLRAAKVGVVQNPSS